MPAWITALAAGVAGVLSGLGIGSAGLFVLYLTLVLEMEQVAAQGLNLLFFLASAGVSLLLHANKRHIPWMTVGLLVVSALPGAAVGTYLASVLDGLLIRRLFGVMLTISGSMALLGKSPTSPSAPSSSSR